MYPSLFQDSIVQLTHAHPSLQDRMVSEIGIKYIVLAVSPLKHILTGVLWAELTKAARTGRKLVVLST